MSTTLWSRFLSVSLSGSKTSQDPWMLNWLLITTVGDKGGPLERLATKIYFKRLSKTWGTLAKVFTAYFNDPNHPLAKYSPK